jgi:Gpi18-like mannosyltransferase
MQRPLPAVLAIVIVLRCALLLFEHTVGSGDWAQAGHRFDSGWYARIAEQGYTDHPERLGEPYVQTEWAFFPLYPLLVRSAMGLTGLRVEAAMELLTWPLLVLFLAGAHALARRLLPPREAGLALLLWLAFPFSVFLHVHYSELLFLVLLVWTFVHLHEARILPAALLLSALVLVRPSGLFMLPAAYLYLLERRHGTALPWLHRPALRDLPVLLAPALAFAAYCYHQFRSTGDPFAFSTAQAGWGRGLSWPWESFFSSGDVASQIESVYTLLLIPAAFLLVRNMPLSLWVLVFLNILVPLFSGSVDSMTRFTLVLFPLFFGAAQRLGPWKRSWTVVLLLVMLQLVCAWLWSTSHLLMA